MIYIHKDTVSVAPRRLVAVFLSWFHSVWFELVEEEPHTRFLMEEKEISL